jgi:hypothetical protein
MCGLGKSWLIQYVKQRIRHIEVYVETNSMESLCRELVAMKREEENQEKTCWLMTVEFVMAFSNELVKWENSSCIPRSLRRRRAIDDRRRGRPGGMTLR